jgi:hypothetical protein
MTELPEYRKRTGSYHCSASGATQPLDEHILKLVLRKEYKMGFPFAARPRAGQIVQEICDIALGLDDYKPLEGQKPPVPIADAIREGMIEFNFYKPRDWDDGKDAEEHAYFKEVIPEMAVIAYNALKEFYDGKEIIGEHQRYHTESELDVPIILFTDYTDGERQIDLKCSFPTRNPPKKDGTRSWRNPKPKTEPTRQQVMQQAVYWKATGEEPALLFVTPEGYNVVNKDNCDALSYDSLEDTYQEVLGRWKIIQNLLRASNGDWKTLFGLVQPDFAQISARHGSEILKIAKELWKL